MNSRNVNYVCLTHLIWPALAAAFSFLLLGTVAVTAAPIPDEKEKKAEADLKAVLTATEAPEWLPSFSWQKALLAKKVPEERLTDEGRSALRRALWQDLRTLARVHAGTTAAKDAERRADHLIQEAWAPLRKQAEAPPKDPERLRRDLLAFRRTFLGAPQAVEAARFLASLPSPLDQLDRKQIPGRLPPETSPELVAVITPSAPTALAEVGGPSFMVSLNPPGLIRFSPDGGSLVVGTSRREGRKQGAILQVWTLTGAAPSPGPTSADLPFLLESLSVSPFDDVLYVSQRGAAGGWHLPFKAKSSHTTWRESQILEKGEWGTAGDLLTTISKDRWWWVRVRDLERNWDPIVQKPFDERVTAAAISEDGLWLAISVEGQPEPPPAKNPLEYLGTRGLARDFAWRGGPHAPSVTQQGLSPAGLGEAIRLLPEEGIAGRITFAPDGRRVALSQGQTVRLVGREPGNRQAMSIKLSDALGSLVFSPDGETLAVTVAGRVKLLSATTGRVGRTLSLPEVVWFHEQPVFSPDSRYLAVAGEKAVYVLRLRNATP